MIYLHRSTKHCVSNRLRQNFLTYMYSVSYEHKSHNDDFSAQTLIYSPACMATFSNVHIELVLILILFMFLRFKIQKTLKKIEN